MTPPRTLRRRFGLGPRPTELAAGLAVADEGGHLVKPLPNDAMAALDPGLIDAYEELGRQLPEVAAEIWCAGRPA